MRRFASVLTRRNLVAMAAGTLLAGVPLIIFNTWLAEQVDRQAQWEIATASRRALTLAEMRIETALTTLDAIAPSAGTVCTPAITQTLRRAAFEAAPVKQAGVLAADGRLLCSEPELPFGVKEVTSSQSLLERSDTRLEVINLSDGQRMLRIRRIGAAGEPFILIPTSLLLPQVSIDATSAPAYAAILAQDGTLIVASGERPPHGAAIFGQRRQSSRYGIAVELAAPHELVPAAHNSVRWLGLLISVIAALALAGVLMISMRRRSHDPVAELAEAMRKGEFVPYYQPVVDIRSGRLRGAEVLARWRKPDGTLVLPGQFIPLVESSGLIHEFTMQLMRRAATEMGSVLGRRPALKISFNFSARLFADESIVNHVRKIFADSPIDFPQVVLELTEREPIENFVQVRQVVAALQGLGIRIAIDDVGTGHSGLSYMLKLGVDIIKIDKMFVDAIGTDRNSTTIVETLVDLAHNMRMDVVAEGVENFEQVMHLREVGIRSAQGYVFAPPLPGRAFIELIDAIHPLEVAQSAAA
jgi:sensor c-di-GMP phosphodiesterase-like protein